MGPGVEPFAQSLMAKNSFPFNGAQCGFGFSAHRVIIFKRGSPCRFQAIIFSETQESATNVGK